MPKSSLGKGKKPAIEKIMFLEANINSYAYIKNMCLTLQKFCKKMVYFNRMQNYFKYGKKGMNERFLEAVKREKPDYIFTWLTGDEFYIKTLLEIRNISPNTKTVAIFGDDSTQFENYSRYYGLLFDYSFTVLKRYVGKYKKDGINTIFSTTLTDTHNFKPMKVKKELDVTFVGSQKLDRSGRYEFIKYLKDKGVPISVYGFGWEHYPEIRDIYKGTLGDNEMVKLINQSKINLCFSKDNFGNPQLKAKVTEVSACKSFVLCEYAKDYEDYYAKKELATFEGRENLLKKIKYFLAHEKEREKIASLAYKRTMKDYGLYNELKSFFDKTKGKSNHRELPQLNKKVLTLSAKELELSQEKIKDLVKDKDYIAFNQGGATPLEYKEYFQVYALEKSHKKVSCCDFYLHSKALGDYVKSDIRYVYGLLDKKSASSIVDINQLVVKKEYFLAHYREFKKAFQGKSVDFIETSDMAFVSIPLVRVKNIKIQHLNLDRQTLRNVMTFSFLFKLYTLVNQKRIITDPYFYNLLFEGFTGKKFILEVLADTFFNKNYWVKLIKYK